MTVQEILEKSVRIMVPDALIENVARNDDGTAYAWLGKQFWLIGFIDHDLAYDLNDGFFTVRRRMFLGFPGDDFDYRAALAENFKYPGDIVGLAHLCGKDVVIVTSTTRLALSIGLENLPQIICMSCGVSAPPMLSGLSELPDKYLEAIWNKHGFELLHPR